MITNLEQFEAYQEKQNSINTEKKKTMAETELLKLEAVEKATKILLEANVPAFIFGLVNMDGRKYPGLIQYNTAYAMLKEGSDGKLTKESRIMTHLINSGMCPYLFGMVLGWNGDSVNPKALHHPESVMHFLYQLASKKYSKSRPRT